MADRDYPSLGDVPRRMKDMANGTFAEITASVPIGADGEPITHNTVQSPGEYETVAASQTDQVLGATGALGDYLEGVLCVVATAATAQVQIQDGAGTAFTVFPNSPGAGVGTYYVPIGAYSTAGAWSITTGAGVSVLATGQFT
jgi:hypothetical protein